MGYFQTPAAIRSNGGFQAPIDKHGLTDPLSLAENLNPLDGKIPFFLFREEIPKPVAILVQRYVQSLIRDVVDNYFHCTSLIICVRFYS
jgi:hypothetical protein